jgi:hypothetical protein
MGKNMLISKTNVTNLAAIHACDMTYDASLANAFQMGIGGKLRFIIATHRTSSRSIAIMQEELTALIIEELGKRHDRKEIIHKIQARTGWNWKQAHQLILFVQTQHRKSIAARQSPRLFLLSIGTFAVGMMLVAFNLNALLAFFQQDLLTSIRSLPWNNLRVIESFTGLVIALAGMIGLWRGLSFIFPD